MMKNILVLAHNDDGQEARLQVALDITRAVDGHLTCLDVAMNPLLGDDYVSSYTGAQLAVEEKRNETANRARIEARIAEEGLPYTWIDMDGDAAICMRESATLADLIVVNRSLDDEAAYPNMFNLAGDLIMDNRLPVFAVPQKARSIDLGGHAIVAWDGSNHAAAAMRAALPLLKLAGSVTLFHAQDGSLKVPLEEAAAYLSRHGIHPTIRRELCLMDRPGSLIMAEAMIGHAAYVVMGAFSRSRFVEAAFGGATQRMLTESPVPVLFVHAA
jgi:nucleotide-binding universal stress UspA family protein